MNKKIKHLLSILSCGLVATILSPTIASCSKQYLNYTKGDVVDFEDSDNKNNQDYKVGLLPNEFKHLEENKNNTQLHLNVVTNNINFLDYKLPSNDENGVYKYVHERDGFEQKTVSVGIKQNVNNFLENFNFNEYVTNFNNSINDSNKDFLSLIPTPSNLTFLYDVYYWMLSIYYSNESNFDIEIKNKNVNFNSLTNKISFDIDFSIKNIRKNNILFKLIDNNNFELIPNKNYVLKISAIEQPIKNIINVYNKRFFLGWQIPKVTLNFDNKSIALDSFNPTITSNSFSYMIEFLNLTTDENVDTKTDQNALEFMQKLDTTVIKENVEATAMANTNKAFAAFPQLALIFESLKKDPTIGQFLNDTSQPLVKLLEDFGVIPKELSPIIIDLLQSVHTGKGILDILVTHKKSLSNILKRLLSGVLGQLTDLVDTILTPIKPNMTKEQVDGFLKLLNMFFGDDNNTTKEFIVMLLQFLLGNFDDSGNKLNDGNPYILDIIDFLISDNLRDKFLTTLSGFGLNINKTIFDAIAKIYSEISTRAKNDKGMTIVSEKGINYNEKLISKLFDIKNTGKNTATWWFMDQVVIIMNALGMNVGTDNTSLLYELIYQSYAHDYNKDNLNKNNVILALNEISNAFNFLANQDNFDIVYGFNEFDDKSIIKYNSKTFECDFTFNYKLIFKKEFTFNLDVILNVLPTDLYIEIYKLTGNEYVHASGFGFYTRNRYVWINLERILYRMFPRKLPFNIGDSFNMEYKSNNKKLIYSVNVSGGKYYHGFNTIIDLETYFDQASKNNGIISNVMKTAWVGSDFAQIKDDHHMDQNPPSWNISGVIADIDYENKDNSQSSQNISALTEMIQKLLVNKMKFNINLIGLDKSKEINKSSINDAYYVGKTFKWQDIDLNQENIIMNQNPTFKSTKYQDYYNMFTYTNETATYDYSHVNNQNGQEVSKSFVRQVPSFSSDSINLLKNDLFSLGNNVNPDETLVSVKPISNVHFNKKVIVKGGAKIGIIPITALTLELEINVQMLMFQVTVMTPNKVLDLSQITRENNKYTLTNYQYSNVFDKIVFAPRISIKMPNL